MSDSSATLKRADIVEFMRMEVQRRYLSETIFIGLPELSISFDVPTIRYFTTRQFRQVVKRCRRNRVGILGVEVFTSQGWLVDVHIATGDGAGWCLGVLNTYRDRKGLLLSATYSVPDQVEICSFPGRPKLARS